MTPRQMGLDRTKYSSAASVKSVAKSTQLVNTSRKKTDRHRKNSILKMLLAAR